MAGILVALPCLRFTPACGRSLQNISLRWRKRDLVLSRSVGFLRVLDSGGAQATDLWRTHPRRLSTLALSQHNQEHQPSSDQFRLIYQFPGIRHCRAVSRMKLLQTALTVVILPPMWFLCWQNQVTQAQCLYTTGIAVFAAIMLYSMSFYLRRIVGMMYLNEDGTLLRVAHLTFWGKRKDFCCPVETVMTLSDMGDSKNELLHQFRQHGREEFFYFTLRFGEVVDQEGFVKVFGALQ
ncbi:transmembrane protein 186 [Tiliqua scincoides]|uniref:transmembrane protein 186 n=1 Tax=Tiliqua scincoides TaxID=71010 RepID=UPI0034629ACC